MRVHHSRNLRGFTLVELAIVLAVVAVLLAGLWRLLSGGNQQLIDQTTADQHKIIMNAARNYLASTDGQVFVGSIDGTSLTPIRALALPGTCPAAPAAGTIDCAFLPPGITAATQNAYGQTYTIGVRRDDGLAAPVAASYSLMVLTQGGRNITDTSGGRIAGFLGGEGGFVYNADVCNPAFTTTACGAFNGWQTGLATYFAAPVADSSGHIATRSTSALSSQIAPWLARQQIPGDTIGAAGSLEHNSIQTNTWVRTGNNFSFLGNSQLNFAGDTPITGRATWQQPALDNALVLVQPVGAPNPALSIQGAGGTDAIRVNNANIFVDGDVTAVNLTATTLVYSPSIPSDLRLKHDIKTIKDPLDHLKNIRAVWFTSNINDEHKTGVLAQDVEKSYPHLIKEIGGGYKGVDYMGLMGPVIGAVNELRARNDELQEQVQAQAQEIAALRKSAKHKNKSAIKYAPPAAASDNQTDNSSETIPDSVSKSVSDSVSSSVSKSVSKNAETAEQ